MPTRFAALYLAAASLTATVSPAFAQQRPATPRPVAPAARPAPAAQPLARSTFLSNMDQQFGKVDADKNGQVTREEAAAFERIEATATASSRNRALFVQLDADRNGQISPEEFRRLIQPPSQATGQKFLQQMDLNRDGRVTLVEHRAATVANFDKIDLDKDGVVTAAEMKAAGVGGR